jgi:hypothetical protein
VTASWARFPSELMIAHRGRSIALVTAATLIVGLTLFGVEHWRSTGARPAAQLGIGPGQGYPLDSPVIRVTQPSTLESAKTVLNGYLPFPDSAEASTDNIAKVWVNAKSGEVDIYFSSGLRLLLEPASLSSQDAIKAEDARVVEQSGGASLLDTINGVTAVVTARDFAGSSTCGIPNVDCVPAQQNPSDVAFVLNGVSVALTADWPIDKLVAVAKTVS